MLPDHPRCHAVLPATIVTPRGQFPAVRGRTRLAGRVRLRQPVSVFDVEGIRERFPALARMGTDGRAVVLVDAPGGSQVPDTVIDAVAGHYRRGLSNTHGSFPTSEETDAVITDARRAAADLVGVEPDEIVFGANATTLLFHLSRSFG